MKQTQARKLLEKAEDVKALMNVIEDTTSVLGFVRSTKKEGRRKFEIYILSRRTGTYCGRSTSLEVSDKFISDELVPAIKAIREKAKSDLAAIE